MKDEREPVTSLNAEYPLQVQWDGSQYSLSLSPDFIPIWAKLTTRYDNYADGAGVLRTAWGWRKQQIDSGGQFIDSDDLVGGMLSGTSGPLEWPAFPTDDKSYSTGDIVRLYPGVSDKSSDKTINHGLEWFFSAPKNADTVLYVRVTGPIDIDSRQPCIRQVYKNPIGDSISTTVFQDDTAPDAAGWLLFNATNPTGETYPVYWDGTTQYPYPLGSYVAVVVVPDEFNYPFGDGKHRYIPWEPPAAGWNADGVINRQNQILGLGIKATEGIGLSPYGYFSGDPTGVPSVNSLCFGNMISGSGLLNGYLQGGAGGSTALAVSFTTGIGPTMPDPLMKANFVQLIALRYGFPVARGLGSDLPASSLRWLDSVGLFGCNAALSGGSPYFWGCGFIPTDGTYWNSSQNVGSIFGPPGAFPDGGPSPPPFYNSLGIAFPTPTLFSDIAVAETVTSPSVKTTVYHGISTSGTGYKFVNGICIGFTGSGGLTIGSTLVTGGTAGGTLYEDGSNVLQSSPALAIDGSGNPWFQGSSGKWFSIGVGSH